MKPISIVQMLEARILRKALQNERRALQDRIIRAENLGGIAERDAAVKVLELRADLIKHWCGTLVPEGESCCNHARRIQVEEFTFHNAIQDPEVLYQIDRILEDIL